MNVLIKNESVEYSTQVFNDFNNLVSFTNLHDDLFVDTTKNAHHTKNGRFTKKDYKINEKTFVENYGNPLASVSMVKRMFVIEENEDKISIKTYYYHRSREVAKKHFKVRREVDFLTFSYKRKMFYSGSCHFKRKRKIGSKFITNKARLGDIRVISKLYHYIAEKDEYTTILDMFLDKIVEKLNIKFKIENKSVEEKYYQIILHNNKIKYPNAFFKFSSFYTPKKLLKKYDYNLVDWFMGEHKLKGAKVRNILNKYEKVDFQGMYGFYHLLGIDLFNKVSDKSFLLNGSSNDIPFFEIVTDTSYPKFNLSRKEKENIASILDSAGTTTLANSFYEHCTFKEDLKRYGEYVKIEAKNYEDYVEEHSRWSALLQSYRTGYVTRYYGEDAKLVQKPIYYNGETYYPVLFTTTEEYENESMMQHNCVRTYSEKPYCLIISLRKGSLLSEQRVTIEFQFRVKELYRTQTLGKYNRGLDEEWTAPVIELTEFANYLYQKGMIKLPKMTKRFPNGKTMTSQSTFSEGESDGFRFHRLTPYWDNQFGNNNDYLQDEFVNYDFDIDLP
jgi:hypothetical protein